MRPQNKHLKKGPGPGRPKGSRNKATVEIKAMARALTLEDSIYLEKLKARLRKGTCNATVETTLLYYGYGKPAETIKGELAAPLTFLTRHPIGSHDPLAAEPPLTEFTPHPSGDNGK